MTRRTSAVQNGISIRPIPGWWSFADIAELFEVHRNMVHYMAFHAQEFGDPEKNLGAAGARTYMVRASAVRRVAAARGEEMLRRFQRRSGEERE